ncbi:MAG TPA: ABC transporter ATP-binding protein [Candidatus Bathyarchaeota archaeon]|nr:ABC transporter ATP-binding protein [Candidatus Bathyarchaeota archaeon]
MSIVFKDASFRYANSEKWAVKALSFRIEPGEKVLISGPSGSGKSTICRMINGLIPHFYEGEFKGVVEINGLDTRNVRVARLSRDVGLVFQNPENQLVALSVEREISFGLENLGIKREEILRRIDWVLRLFNIERLRKRLIHELSGGEKQLVILAAIVAMKPKILVLDEPTAELDPANSIRLVNMINELSFKLGLTVVIVEQRVDLIAPIVDRVLVLEEGEIIAYGRPWEVYSIDKVYNSGSAIPKLVELYYELQRVGVNIDRPALTVEEFLEVLRFK